VAGLEPVVPECALELEVPAPSAATASGGGRGFRGVQRSGNGLAAQPVALNSSWKLLSTPLVRPTSLGVRRPCLLLPSALVTLEGVTWSSVLEQDSGGSTSHLHLGSVV